jgi:predicted GIY-YIG superfamily endonuclease
MTHVEPKGYWVYIAELGDGRLYVGVTNNPDRRAVEHHLGSSIRTTRVFGFKKLLYTEPHPDMASARKREVQVKKWTRAKKLALIAGDQARLKELSRSRQGRR